MGKLNIIGVSYIYIYIYIYYMCACVRSTDSSMLISAAVVEKCFV